MTVQMGTVVLSSRHWYRWQLGVWRKVVWLDECYQITVGSQFILNMSPNNWSLHLVLLGILRDTIFPPLWGDATE